jgi:hypothetical protein
VFVLVLPYGQVILTRIAPWSTHQSVSFPLLAEWQPQPLAVLYRFLNQFINYIVCQPSAAVVAV